MGTTQSTKTKIGFGICSHTLRFGEMYASWGKGFGYHRMTYKLLKPIDQMLKELARKNRMTPIQQLDDLIENEYKSKFRK